MFQKSGVIEMDTQNMRQLVERAQRGDREAYGRLVEQFGPTVLRIVQRRLRDASEAEEISQDVFICAMRKLHQLRSPERFPGWLRQIAARMSLNRATRRSRDLLCDPDRIGAARAVPSEMLAGMVRCEEASQLRSCLDGMRDMDRRTLIAFYFEGQSLKQMSDDFDSPVGTIKRRLHTARRRLRDKLSAAQLRG